MPTVSGREPLGLALLAANTAHSNANIFAQFEGWPAQAPFGGERHNADKSFHDATLWNFATFGACAYSEKRSTPIFLANDKFDLTLRPDTGMPYYWGANAGNAGASWMNRELIRVLGDP